MFGENTVFNQNLEDWDVSNVTFMGSMFSGAIAFDQNLGSWDISKVTDMSGMFDETSLSTENYDKTLQGWASLTLQNDVFFDGGLNQYCEGWEARKYILDNFDWIIIDGGEAIDCRPDQRPFITTWKTDNPGTSEDNQITIPTYPDTLYNYNVDWGDGTSDTNVTGDITHTYPELGTYQVAITGEFPGIYFNVPAFEVQDSNHKIIQVNQWGDIRWRDFSYAFSSCRKLDVVATDSPNLKSVSSTQSMFSFCTSLTGNQSFEVWNVSNIIYGSGMFSGCFLFNQDIGGWDVSNMVHMDYFFSGARSFNQPIGDWDISNAEEITGMFNGAQSFDQPVGKWHFPKVTRLSVMFQSAESFNQDISSWDVSRIMDFSAMFNGARSFDQPIGIWDVSSGIDLSLMFQGANSFNSDITNWDISNAENIAVMFGYNISFNQDISSWDVSNIKNIGGLFWNNTVFNQDLSSWNTSNVTDMGRIFDGALAFDGDISSWDVSKVEDMSLMFENSGISLENYDKILAAWTNLPSLQSNVIFDAGNSRFCESEEARQFIIDTYDWIINDAGKAPYCNEDNDGDGILDHLDACLDTLPGAEVNANGCDTISNTAVTVYTSTPSCIGNEDGSIEITLDTEGYMLDISVESDSYSNQFMDIPSGTSFKVVDLPVGSYSVSISIPEIVFEQQYVATINSLESVTGKRAALDPKKATATYAVSGSNNYQVFINEEKKHFSFPDSGLQTITLDNIPAGQVTVTISGESDCQGKVYDSFYHGDSIEVFPTITSSMINIYHNSPTLKAELFDFTGRMVKEKRLDGQTNTLDLSTMKSGLYVLKLYMAKEQRTLKIIKK